MVYYFYLMFFNTVSIITGTNVLAINGNTNEMTSNTSLSFQYGRVNNLQKIISDIKQPLTKTFPFLSSINGLCVQLYNFFRDEESLNLGVCKRIKSFQLKASNISEIPEYVKSFSHIYDLNLSSNKLKSSCFDIISELSTLKSLNLQYNLIEEVPQSILKLVNLEDLKLSADTFINVPDFISDFKLKNLYLNQLNPIVDKFNDVKRNEDIGLKIINDFSKIKSLECLILNLNNISILNLHTKNYSIKRLDLVNNNISQLSDSIIKFKNLEYLDLSINHFTKVPTILSKLERLKELNLSENYIISYKDIWFYSLETLSISFSAQCEDFSIHYLFSPIKHLHIYNGPYSCKIFSEIYNMVYLKSLSIFHEFIESGITNKIKMLKNLESLQIASIRVECINDSIFELKNLKTFHLKLNNTENNGFPEILFDGLKKLTNLEDLSLEDPRRMSKLNDKIFELENLKKIKLNGFFIEKMENFKRIKNLKDIIIKNTRFRELEKNVKLSLRIGNQKVQYYSCTYGSGPLEKERFYLCLMYDT